MLDQPLTVKTLLLFVLIIVTIPFSLFFVFPRLCSWLILGLVVTFSLLAVAGVR